jgi:hypothetical protein
LAGAALVVGSVASASGFTALIMKFLRSKKRAKT